VPDKEVLVEEIDIMSMLGEGEKSEADAEVAVPEEAVSPEVLHQPLEGDVTMQFETKRFAFQQLLEKAARVVPAKDIMPVLKNFLIELTAEGVLRVMATDLELSILSSTEAVRMVVPGSAVFPAKKLLTILREADEGDVEVALAGGTARIIIANASWQLRLPAGDDYPMLPDTSNLQVYPVDRVRFLAAVQAVRGAAARESTRANLMMLDVSNGKMTACDGVRFQQARLGEDFPLSLQIPIGAVDDLLTILRSTELEHVQIGESENFLVFRVGTDVFVANKLDAQFPDVEKIMLRPALENRFELQVDRQELIDAVKRVRINADTETSAIGLRISDGHLTVVSRDKYGNAAEEELLAGWSQGDRLIVVNHTFLSDMLTMYDAASCQFRLGTDTKSRKSPVMLSDEESGTVGIIQQLSAALLGYDQ
jgi:DNA polymerase-3 subunit beta